MELVAVDIGGTHARFAIAEIADGRVAALGDFLTLKTADYASLQTAWQAFGKTCARPLPRAAAFAVAAPMGGEIIALTNNPWIIRPAQIREQLGIDDFVLINDFGAIGHAVAQVDDALFAHLAGPDRPLPDHGILTVCGPGTGLGVAQVLRAANGYQVIETQGGHTDFAPLDPVEDGMLQALRKTFQRVSTERIVAGPGIVAIYETLAAIEGRAVQRLSDKAIWQLALDDHDSLALAALDRFCLCLGAVAGDLALAQGAAGVVIAGGLGLRLKEYLTRSGFAERFVAKGRFRSMMEAIPVKLITHPQPGLYGAAAAFAQRHTS